MCALSTMTRALSVNCSWIAPEFLYLVLYDMLGRDIFEIQPCIS
jgi:hypothetical protein